MTNVAKLRHQLTVAQTLAKSHINFVVIPVIEEDPNDEAYFAKLQAWRLEQLIEKAKKQ